MENQRKVEVAEAMTHATETALIAEVEEIEEEEAVAVVMEVEETATEVGIEADVDLVAEDAEEIKFIKKATRLSCFFVLYG